MKIIKITALALAICTLFAVSSCSNRRKVTVIQGTNQPPENKKPIDAAPTAELPHNFSDDITVTFGDEAMTLKDPHSEYTFKYTKIEELMYMTNWNYGSDKLIDGTNTEYEIYAKMQTPAEEEYHLHIYKTTPVYVAVYYGGTQYIFNLDSATSTKE
ncbi:MAG: hypothetical protein IJO93_00205, partial [Clostridia bacterium]|nr:hypothetical protein [Clostridia bacterium]